MPGSPEASRWRFLITPKWLAWHAFVILSVVGMGWLGYWQFRRAEAGNALSWAFTFEWPLFAIFAVVFWIKTIRDEVHPPAPATPPAAGDELAPYNADLARLAKEVRGHGRWHGLR